MPHLRLKATSKNWFACIHIPGGKPKYFSTGTPDKEEAYALAIATERALKRPRPSQVREALLRIIADYEVMNDVKASTFILQWAKTVKGSISKNTSAAYTLLAKEFAKYLDFNHISNLAEISSTTIQAFRDQLTCGYTTKNTKVKILSVVFSSAKKLGYITTNPTEGVQRLQPPRSIRREFRAKELRILLDNVSGEWKTLTLLGLYTGQRMSDLATLRWSSIDMIEKTIIFHSAKTNRLIHLPLLPPVMEALATSPAGDKPESYVLPDIAKLAQSSRSGKFAKILAQCGLSAHRHKWIRPTKLKPKPNPPPNTNKRKSTELSFHSLRHSATTMLKAAGVSDAIARAIIGHESAAVSRAYTHLDLDTIRQAMEKLPSIQ